MINEKLQEAFNAQINRELFSMYLYLQMRAWFVENNLDGFANWMDVQAKEEQEHAMGLYIFLLNKGGKVQLRAIDQPETNFADTAEIYRKTLEHEQFITRNLYELMDMSLTEKDFAASSFLKWYMDEQVEEEANPTKILDRLSKIGKDPQGLAMLDAELAARVYTPLNIPGAILV